MENNHGIVYVLTNPAMPGIIKIGRSNQEDVKYRMSQLYSTGVPLPFECVYAAKVSNYEKVEKALHIAFGPDRLNPNREFFEIEPSQAKAIIKLMELQNVSPQVASEKEVVDEIDRDAGIAFGNKRRPRFNFNEMNIPVGSELVNVTNGEIVKVIDDRNVDFRGEERSLTYATRVILDNSYHVCTRTLLDL
ncbi:MAG: GIY-YIG nuclease family protein [Bacteroidetes bacterium]|nr:GIY-YIG nuclease family protein [Bacteroidota bacterium]